MKRLLGVFVVVALAGCFATVGEDGQVVGQAGFTLSLPTILPPLIVVEPGVSVVSDYDDEVFYSGGYYWVRQDTRWYRSHDHRRGWAQVEARRVPAPIVRSPPGRYRHYRGNGQAQNQNHDGRDSDHDGRDRDDGHR